MKVRIGNDIFDSSEHPIMLILTQSDKDNISKMHPDATKFCVYPDKGYTAKDIEEFMMVKLGN